MDEQHSVQSLREGMEREAELYTRLGAEMDRLRDSFVEKKWTESLTIAQSFESSAHEVEAAEAARDRAFTELKDGLGASAQERFSMVLMRVPPGERAGLEEAWRKLRTSVFRLKTLTGRLRYSAETMSETLNRVLEGVFPHRRGKIYTRHGTPTKAIGSLLIDREL
jgi:hypothetical protein